MDFAIHTAFVNLDVLCPSCVCQYRGQLGVLRHFRAYRKAFYRGKGRVQP